MMRPTPGDHLIRNAALAAPLIVLVAGLWRGSDGAASAVLGIALAAANLFVSARSLEWAAHHSVGAVGAVALGGYVVRLATITVIVLLMKDLTWVDLPAVGISLVVAHLVLAVWEARIIHLAATAAPGQGRE